MNYLDLQIASTAENLPSESQLQTWLDAALFGIQQDNEVVIRIVDEAESAELNQQYRRKTGATNILSFPFDVPDGVDDMDLLGDLVICAPVVAREAKEQGKTLFDHWAHITVHGVLHLLGYDHINDVDADEMETLEIKILATLNIKNPYEEDNTL